MANSKVIIIEGAQGAGKTTVTDYLRHAMTATNLYRLNGTSDATYEGYLKACKMYEELLKYMKNMENLNINLLFDRTFFTEENYCRQGYKDYSFTDEYDKLVDILDNLDFDIYYITIYLDNIEEFAERINRKEKGTHDYAKYKAERSIGQQKVYLEMAEELKTKAKNIKVINIKNDRPFAEVKEELKDLLKY